MLMRIYYTPPESDPVLVCMETGLCILSNSVGVELIEDSDNDVELDF